MVLPKVALIVLSTVPLILLILSFAFTLKATLTHDWVVRENYSQDIMSPADEGLLHRSVFSSCQSRRLTTGQWKEKCTRRMKPGASCNAGLAGLDFLSLCQQIKVSGQLLIVGCVFTAFAAVATGVLCAATFMYKPAGATGAAVDPVTTETPSSEHDKSETLHHRHNNKHEHHYHNSDTPATIPTAPAAPITLASKLLKYVTIPARIFIAIGSISVFLAAMIGGNALMNVQPPNGQFSSGLLISGSPLVAGADANWRLDKGFGYVTAAWVVGAFGYWAMDIVWGSPGSGLVYW